MTRRILAFVTAILAVLSIAAPNSAESASTQRSRTAASNADQVVLVMTGVIGPGSYRQFRRAVSRGKPDLIVLDGPGGILDEAILIGDEIRRRGLATLVDADAFCASACAVVFLSGRTKYMGRGAHVGLHAASYLDGRADAEATTLMASYLRGVGVPRSILRRMAATAPDDISWLTQAEQKALRIRAVK
jgi:hypothetical protein